MKFVFAAPLFLALMAASAPPVSVIAATGDWSNLPPLRNNGTDHQTKNLIVALNKIATTRQCALPGYTGTNFNFDVSFAALFNPDGTVQQIVIPKLNCPKAEALLEITNGRCAPGCRAFLRMSESQWPGVPRSVDSSCLAAQRAGR